MWPWKRDTLGTVTRRLDEVEGAVRSLKLEWADVLDRLERLAGRLAKREQRDAPVLTGPTPEVRGNSTPAAPPPSGAMAAVLKRRGVR